MTSTLVLLCLFLGALAWPQGGATNYSFLSSAQSTVNLTIPRLQSCVCQFGRFAVIVGGVDDSGNWLAAFDVFDSVQVSYVAQGTVAFKRNLPICASDTVNNQCYVLGGGTTNPTSVVEIITVNNVTGQPTLSNYSTDYPIANLGGVACYGIGGTIYCGGGFDESTSSITNATYYTDGSGGWTAGPVFLYQESFSQNAVLFGSKIAFCGGDEFDSGGSAVYTGDCYLWDTTAGSISTVGGFHNHSGSAFVVSVQLPAPQLLLWGGFDQYQSDIGAPHTKPDVLDYSDGTTVTTLTSLYQDPTQGDITNGGVSGSTSVWTLAFFVSGNGDTQALDGILAVDFYAGLTVNKTFPGARRNGAAITTYKNQVFIHGGYDANNVDFPNLEVLTLGCTGLSVRGTDTWVSNETYNGCDLVNCATAYWGPDCTACNCALNELCDDGYTGTGHCTLNPSASPTDGPSPTDAPSPTDVPAPSGPVAPGSPAPTGTPGTPGAPTGTPGTPTGVPTASSAIAIHSMFCLAVVCLLAMLL